MHPYRGIVHTDRQSDGISTRPYEPNNLINQSAGTNTNPRDTLHALLHGILSDTARSMYMSTATSTVPSYPLPSHLPQACRHFKSLPIASYYLLPRAPSSESKVLHNSTVPTWFDSRFSTVFDSGFPNSIRLKVFDDIRLRFFRLVSTQVFDWIRISLLDLTHIFSIWFDSYLTKLFSIWVASFKSHSSQALGSPTLDRVFSK